MYKAINKSIQKFSKKKYSFITGNGTSAIYLALKCSKIKKKSYIAISNISCPDLVYAIIWAGYRPYFIDIELSDYNISVNSLEKSISENSNIKGVVAVHLFGNSCDISRIHDISKNNNIFLIEDCAQSFGLVNSEYRLGSYGDVSIYSFGNGKILELGHGGSIQSDDKTLIDKVKVEYKKLPIFDKVKIDRLSKVHRYLYYKIYYLGLRLPVLNILNLVYVYFFRKYYLYRFNSDELSKMQALIMKIESNKMSRANIFKQYEKDLKNLVNFPRVNNQGNSLTRLTVLIEDAEYLSEKIRSNNAPSNTMYPMLIDRFKLFYNKDEYQNSFKVKGRMLNLWLNNIDRCQIKSTIQTIQKETL
jgi:dTDP-4-amino-4,6-dideoxygalactose transaminase